MGFPLNPMPKAGILPILRVLFMAMFDRGVVDVIEALLEIRITADQTLPSGPLPGAATMLSRAALGWPFATRKRPRVVGFSQSPAYWEIIAACRRSPQAMEVFGQDQETWHGVGAFKARLSESLFQQVNVVYQNMGWASAHHCHAFVPIAMTQQAVGLSPPYSQPSANPMAVRPGFPVGAPHGRELLLFVPIRYSPPARTDNNRRAGLDPPWEQPGCARRGSRLSAKASRLPNDMRRAWARPMVSADIHTT